MIIVEQNSQHTPFGDNNCVLEYMPNTQSCFLSASFSL